MTLGTQGEPTPRGHLKNQTRLWHPNMMRVIETARLAPGLTIKIIP